MLSKVKALSFQKKRETIKKMKRIATDWEKTFVNHIFDKRLAFRIYKELKTQQKEDKPDIKNGIDITPTKVYVGTSLVI